MTAQTLALRSPATRTLAICADDFGQSKSISAAVVDLAQAGRLTAISCLTNSPHWPASARLLTRLPPSVDIGLHLNLTEGRPLSRRLGRRWRRPPGLGRLIVAAHLGLVPRAELRSEFHAQLASFINTVGVAPAFIDGHQHIHHLPVVRGLILDMAEHVQPLPAVRSTARVVGPGAAVKRWLIEATGGRALQRQLEQRLLAHNPVLLGAYDFTEPPSYRLRMQRWLAALPAEGGLLFCHPGQADGSADPIAAARERELAYLESDAFAADLAAADVVLGRVWRVVNETSTPG